MNSDSTEIYLDCVNKLVGAPEVKTRVLHALALGHPSYESQAHLVKCRVKDLESLVKKINDRNANDSTRRYCANDITDIVGLRLLALYRKDLPSLVAQFLKFLQAGQKEEFHLFVGDKIGDACTEIILYTSALQEDPVDNAILRIFEEQDIPAVFSGPGADEKEGGSGLSVEVRRKESGYSSLHLIVWCRNSAKPEPEFHVPMEVQIRTSLEDVWGEIDHALKYKHAPGEQTGAAVVLKKTADEHLRLLKSQLDACGQFADSIARQISYSESASGPDGPQRPAFTINLGTLTELPVPLEVRETIIPLVDDLKEALQEFRDGNFAKHLDSSIALSRKFENCADGFIQAYDTIINNPDLDKEETKKSSYYLLMEAALCYYWSGNIHDTALDVGGNSEELATKPIEYYQKSLTLYEKIQRRFSSEGDAILAYRMATVFSALGDEDFARERYREAAENLAKYEQDNFSDDHYLRIRIPRQYGISLWEAAERYRLRGEAMGSLDFQKDRRQSLYRQALEITLPLLDLTIGQPEAGPDVRPEEEQLMTANNVVEYSLCILRTGGTRADLAEFGLSETHLADLADLLIPEGGLSKMDVPIWIDTLRAFRSQLLEDKDGAKEAAQRVIEVIDANSERAILLYGERFVQEMLDDAKKELDIDD